MSNYIDADILLDDLLEGRCESDILQKVRQAIIDEVIGLDGIDIVLCKECKYWQDNNDGLTHPDCRWVRIEMPDADDFCSYGERQTERSE